MQKLQKAQKNDEQRVKKEASASALTIGARGGGDAGAGNGHAASSPAVATAAASPRTDAKSPAKKKKKKKDGGSEAGGDGEKKKKKKKKKTTTTTTTGDDAAAGASTPKKTRKKKQAKQSKASVGGGGGESHNNGDSLGDVDPNFLFLEVGRGNERAVAAILKAGVSPEILNANHPYVKSIEDASGTTKKHLHITPMHLACEKRQWKILEMLAVDAQGDVNARDSEENSVLILAVKNGAPVSTVERLIGPANADTFICNNIAQNALFFAEDSAVVKYLCQVIKNLLPTVFKMLSGNDDIAKRYAIAAIYSLSQKKPRNAFEMDEGLWGHLNDLIRFDPSGKTPSADTDILLPALAAIYNFAIERDYAVRIGKQSGTFAFLFALMCKHSSETIQLYSGRAIFALSRFVENKEVIATKWFKVLVKLLTNNANKIAQAQACAIVAETSVGFDKGKEQVMRELGGAKIAGLLKTTTHMTPNLCRIVANITNKNKFAQVEIIREGGLAFLVAAVREGATECALAAITAAANVVEILLLEKNDKQREEASSLIFANRETLVRGILECGSAKTVQSSADIQDQLARCLSPLLASERLVAGMKEQKGVLVPLLKQLQGVAQTDALKRIIQQAIDAL
eukprot:TRINITY_DN366_c2_g1_i1.p1 TRINITY_DN366_c2_g1~~TRINITY_DN366_c2_g1_i1.p1  ORF type:complete len:628 (-),score=161.77 TRINITY_DN366_c2_g1_i1:18-1901(-)